MPPRKRPSGASKTTRTRSIELRSDLAKWGELHAEKMGFDSLGQYVTYMLHLERDMPKDLRASDDPEELARQIRAGLRGPMLTREAASARIKAAIARASSTRKAG